MLEWKRYQSHSEIWPIWHIWWKDEQVAIVSYVTNPGYWGINSIGDEYPLRLAEGLATDYDTQQEMFDDIKAVVNEYYG